MKSTSRLMLSACTAALFLGGASYAQDTSTDDQAEAERTLDTIAVTGIRGSLQRGLAVKENADVILDAISAEELGKFPDQNVAESLQRVTGVAITRSRGGEGQFVTVRGLGQEFNTLTYNGRELATENAGREFSFDVIPSELINAAQVFKTTTASQTDGSIGGLVNIQTARALSNPGPHLTFSAGTQLEGLNNDFGFKGAVVASNTFANDTIGIIGSVSFQERDFRTDTAESIFLFRPADFNGDGIDDRLNSFNTNVNFEDRERFGATLALEWEPNDRTSVTIDGLFTSFDSPATSSSVSFFPGPGIVTDAVVNEFNDVISQTSVPTGDAILGPIEDGPFGPAFNNIFDFVGRRAETDTDTFQIGGNWKQQITDRWSFELDASYSRADGVRDNIGTNGGQGSFFVVSFPGQFFTQTDTGNAVPDVSITAIPVVPNGTSAPLPLSALPAPVSIDQLGPEGARLHFSLNSSNAVEDELFTIRGDTDFEFDNATISAGFDFITRDKNNSVFDNVATQCGDGSIALPTLPTRPDGTEQNGFFCDRSILFSELLTPEQLSTLFTPFNGSEVGFLSGTDANVPRDFQFVNIPTVEAAFEQLGVLTGVGSFLTPSFNPTSSNQIDENIFSAYVQADWEGELGPFPYRANAGVRVSYTDLTSTGVGAVLTSIVIDDVSGNNVIAVDPAADIVETNSYFDVLPSFNISLDLTDNVIFRTGFSQSLARPTFVDLSTVFAVTQINEGAEEAAGSNPQLEAVRSNNLDISLEYYGDNGLTVTLAGFYKDIDDFINNVSVPETIVIPESTLGSTGEALGPQPIEFLVSGPQNGDTAEIFGLEIGAQYLFGDNTGPLEGFGVSGNITLADSNSTIGGASFPFENISNFTANASIFYENYGFQGRVSLNHRGDFLSSTMGEGGFAEFTQDFTQVDVSFSYNIGQFVDRDFSVFVEGINVNNEPFLVTSSDFAFPGSSLLESFIENGSRWLFGVRASF